MKPLPLRLLGPSSLLLFVSLLTAFAANSPRGEDIPRGEKAKYNFENS